MTAAAAATAGDDVVVSVEGSVMVVTINRPRVRNAVNLAVSLGISAALDVYEQRPDVRAAVLTGAGGTFCAGMDLKAFASGQPVSDGPRGFAGIVRQPPAKPIVAAVEGFALGGGLEVALACDLIVAAEDAVLGLPEVSRGLTANGGGLLRLPRRVPYQLAAEMIYTGQPITAARGYEIGLVNRVAPPGEAVSTAMVIAGQIAKNAPLALAASKRVIVESPDWPAAQAFTRQEEIVDPVRKSVDAAEGARSFAERRTPVWTGR